MNDIKEASIIGNYLMGEIPPLILLDRYLNAIRKTDTELTGFERKMWGFVLKFPFLIGFADAGLTLTYPQSLIRKKIFIMAATLEATPYYAKYFLPLQTSFFQTLKVLFACLRAFFRLVLGTCLVKLFQWVFK